MSEVFGTGLPWWGWLLLLTGGVTIVVIAGALFLPDWPAPPLTTELDAAPGSEAFLAHVGRLLNAPVLRGGEVTLLQNGDGFFPEMLRAIREARETVHFEVYIFEPDEIGRQFMDAFIERARAGIDVRLLLDAFGARALRKRHRRELRDAGIRVERFRPLSLRHFLRLYRRTHRRAMVIDGRVAFTGGAAISRKWAGNIRTEHEWRDNMIKITGPLVAGVQSAFALNWMYCTGEVLAGPRFYPPLDAATAADAGIEEQANVDAGPRALSMASSPSDAQQPIRLLLWLSFVNARSRLWISNSYFLPDIHLRDAVKARARAGVDVRVLVPGKHTDAVPVQWAGQSYYTELLEAGVRIFEFQPAMMHAKTVVVDDAWSIMGSANLDERSLELNEENVVGIAERRLAGDIARGMLEDFARSKEVQLAAWRRRSPVRRVFEAFAKALIEQY